MNSDQLLQLAQKGLRVTLGATASLLETLQDAQRREESFSRLKTEVSQLTEEWAVKGETTEREARHFVDQLLNQQSGYRDASPSGSNLSSPITAPPVAPPSAATPELQQDLQDLTAQLAAIRAELEKLREQDS
jgi:polyhydroxyalkanoate synthesis regulator phasin